MSQAGKTSWPELVGRNVDEAVQIIRQENSSLNVIKTPQNSIVTMDFRQDRVRVYYTATNSVVNAPHVG